MKTIYALGAAVLLAAHAPAWAQKMKGCPHGQVRHKVGEIWKCVPSKTPEHAETWSQAKSGAEMMEKQYEAAKNRESDAKHARDHIYYSGSGKRSDKELNDYHEAQGRTLGARGRFQEAAKKACAVAKSEGNDDHLKQAGHWMNAAYGHSTGCHVPPGKGAARQHK